MALLWLILSHMYSGFHVNVNPIFSQLPVSQGLRISTCIFENFFFFDNWHLCKGVMALFVVDFITHVFRFTSYTTLSHFLCIFLLFHFI